MLRFGVSLVALATLSACGGATGPSNRPLDTASIATSYTSLAAMTKLANFSTFSASQRYRYQTDAAGPLGEFYEGDQPLETDKVQVNYNPRDAVYDLKFNTAGISFTGRYQDPMHRTGTPQRDVPILPNVQYLESGSRGNVQTYFFERPGTNTSYVTWAGFFRYTNSSLQAGNGEFVDPYEAEWQRSAFVYGTQTVAGEVPKTGTATFNGTMFAWMVDHFPGSGRPLDSLHGTNQTTVNFGAGTFSTSLTGTNQRTAASFSASGSGRLTAATANFSGAMTSLSIAGISRPIIASTIEGGFYGPGAKELGAAFRIIGPVNDERLDITGVFTAKAP
jgi:C-lobe and N-lobe beta barrels of Tf-binding protein B